MVASGAGALVPRQIKEDGMRLGVQARAIGDYDSVTTQWAAEACARWGLSLGGVCRRAFDEGPIWRFVAAAGRVRRSHGTPYSLWGLKERVRAAKSDEDAIRAEVARLDELRYEDAEKAARQARDLLREAGGPVAVAQVVGVLASAHRMKLRLDWATVELGEAIGLADVAERRDVVAGLAQRAGTLLMYAGKLEEAGGVLREAMSIYAQLGDGERIAHCWVDLGARDMKDGQPAAALRKLRTALAFEPASTRHRYGAHQNSALAHVALGNLEAAAAAAQRAAEIVPPGRVAHGCTRWVQARISWRRGRLEEAVAHYEATYEALPEAVDRLLVGAERVRVAIELGDARGAAQQAKGLLALHGTLERDSLDERRVLSTAALELAIAGRRAELSADVVDEILGRINRGLEARMARLRERLRP